MATTDRQVLAAKHVRPSNRVGVCIVGWVSGCTIVGIYLSFRFGLGMWLVGQFVLSLALIQWFAILHECGHQTLFGSPRANRWCGHLASFPTLIPFRSWKAIHSQHHRWTGWQDLDPTTVTLTPRPLSSFERILIDVCWKYWLPLFSVLYRVNNFWNAPRLKRVFPKRKEHRAILRNIICLTLIYGAALGAIGAVNGLRLFGLALILTLTFQDVFLLSQHTHVPHHRADGRDVAPVPVENQEIYTRSLRFPKWFSCLVLFQSDAHGLHHRYPSLPGWRLSAFRTGAEGEMHWWHFFRTAKKLRGELFLFRDRRQTGAPI